MSFRLKIPALLLMSLLCLALLLRDKEFSRKAIWQSSHRAEIFNSVWKAGVLNAFA